LVVSQSPLVYLSEFNAKAKKHLKGNFMNKFFPLKLSTGINKSFRLRLKKDFAVSLLMQYGCMIKNQYKDIFG